MTTALALDLGLDRPSILGGSAPRPPSGCARGARRTTSAGRRRPRRFTRQAHARRAHRRRMGGPRPRTTRPRARSAAGRWLPRYGSGARPVGGRCHRLRLHARLTARRQAAAGARSWGSCSRSSRAGRSRCTPRSASSRASRRRRTAAARSGICTSRSCPTASGGAAGGVRARRATGRSSSRCRRRAGARPRARQVERMLSLDVDGSGFPAVGERDPAIGAPAGALPGAAAGELPVALRGGRVVRRQPAHPRTPRASRSRRGCATSSASAWRSAARSASRSRRPG